MHRLANRRRSDCANRRVACLASARRRRFTLTLTRRTHRAARPATGLDHRARDELPAAGLGLDRSVAHRGDGVALAESLGRVQRTVAAILNVIDSDGTAAAAEHTRPAAESRRRMAGKPAGHSRHFRVR